ncbi:MAG: hypothetical protein ACI8VT_003766, partial [Saprospiraceae bacterium]
FLINATTIPSQSQEWLQLFELQASDRFICDWATPV